MERMSSCGRSFLTHISNAFGLMFIR
jgi:hypothetical protein